MGSVQFICTITHISGSAVSDRLYYMFVFVDIIKITFQSIIDNNY